MSLDRPTPRSHRKAWNGGSREAAMRAARERTEQRISAGWSRCGTCHGEGVVGTADLRGLCAECGGAGAHAPPALAQIEDRP